MKKRVLFLSLSIFFLSFPMLSQQSVDTANVPVWVEMMQDPEANFFEVQESFETYWEGRDRHRGDGFKVFKRWEWYWSTRVDENGNFPDPGAVVDDYADWEINYNQNLQGTESINGDWVEIGPRPKPNNGTGQPNGNGRLNYIAFHPTDTNKMYVGSPSGGFWMTSNGGASWQTTTDDLPSLGVSSILVHPTNPSIIYIGTGDRDAGDAPGIGVYKSIDGGQTWFSSNSGMGNRVVGQMLMHPNDPTYLLAATSGGIYRSTNSGTSWTLETAGDHYKDMRFKPGDPDVVYATETSLGANFWRSTDGGDSWSMITSGLPSSAQRYAIGVTPDNPNVVYLLRSQGSAYGGLYKSTNSGVSFSTQSTTPNILQWSENPPNFGGGGQGWYDLCVAVDPNDENVVYVGGVNIFKSTNGGVTWDCAAHWVGSATAASVHADHHWLEWSPLDGKLYNCNDGGLYYTADDGLTWPEISDSLGIAQIYRIGVSQNSHEFVINGYQDNGTALWDEDEFRTERGGDGMECIIDPSNDDVIYASIYFGNIARSFNNGYNFGGFANGNVISETGAWVTPYIVDPNDPETMFIGYKNVWRTTNAYAGSPTFTAISNSLAGSNNINMRQLRLSKENSNRLYALRSDSRLFRSDNVQATSPIWTELTSFLPGGTLIEVETSPDDYDQAWIIKGNTVYETTDAGLNWTNISGNLPGGGVSKNCLLADPYSDGGLYVGTDAGVYYTDNSLTNWTAFDDGLPTNAEVTELEIYHPNGNWAGSRLRAATYGRGLWESDLYDPGTNAPLAFFDIDIDSTDICNPDTIKLSNNSAYGVDSLHWSFTPSNSVTYVNGSNDTSQIIYVVIDSIANYDVTLFVENSNGSDTLIVQDAIVVSGGVAPPLVEDFEDNTPCSTGGCVTICNSLDWLNVSNGSGDDTDWRTDFGGTPSNGTGPTVDFDPGTALGNYMYVEASWCTNQTAILESPCITLENLSAPEIKFAYHREGWAAWMGDLEVDIFSNGSWTNLETISGIQGSQWQMDSMDLSAYVGEHVKLRFVGNSGSEWQADMALDGIELTAAPYSEFEANVTAACLGQAITLIDQSSQSPSTWNWTVTPNTFNYINGTTSSSQHPQMEFTANGFYTISLETSNAYGSHVTTKNAYMEITSPDPQLMSVSPTNTFCPEDTARVFAVAGMVNYKFYRNGVIYQQGSNDTCGILNPQSGDVISVIVEDSAGCEGTDTITIDLFDSPSSVLTSSDDDLEICDGDTVVFTNAGQLISTHAFYRQGALAQEDSINTWTTDQLANGDSVQVRITDINGCDGTSNAVYTSVLPLPPTPSIMYLMDSLNCTIAGELYRWSFNNNDTVTDSDMYAKQGDGDYRVRIFDDGCWSLWSEPFIITGFDELGGFELKAYPSPASETLHLQLMNYSGSSVGQISVYDMSGKQVLSRADVSLNSGGDIDLNIQELSAGAYSVVIETDAKRMGIVFIKELR